MTDRIEDIQCRLNAYDSMLEGVFDVMLNDIFRGGDDLKARIGCRQQSYRGYSALQTYELLNGEQPPTRPPAS